MPGVPMILKPHKIMSITAPNQKSWDTKVNVKSVSTKHPTNAGRNAV